jgi:hypothetical protein
VITVKISKMCGCAKREKIPEVQYFEDTQTAFNTAESMVKQMNETFCQKHIFSVQKDGDNFIIKVYNN